MEFNYDRGLACSRAHWHNGVYIDRERGPAIDFRIVRERTRKSSINGHPGTKDGSLVIQSWRNKREGFGNSLITYGDPHIKIHNPQPSDSHVYRYWVEQKQSAREKWERVGDLLSKGAAFGEDFYLKGTQQAMCD